MLAFAMWLFPMGLAFTFAELYDELGRRIGPLESGSSGRSRFNSPWGDALLAFSAFCMLAEEFSLFDLYNKMKRELGSARETVQEIFRLRKSARKELSKIVGLSRDMKKTVNDLHLDTKEEIYQIEELREQTKRYSTEIKKMRDKMKKERNLVLVTLKWCGVIGGIVLALYVLCELHQLKSTIANSGPNITETDPPNGAGPHNSSAEDGSSTAPE